jgi:hypothetical protein
MKIVNFATYTDECRLKDWQIVTAAAELLVPSPA